MLYTLTSLSLVNQLVGFATQNGGTTGGAGGPTTTYVRLNIRWLPLSPNAIHHSVTSLAALRSAVAGTDPKIIQVSGIITGGNTSLLLLKYFY